MVAAADSVVDVGMLMLCICVVFLQQYDAVRDPDLHEAPGGEGEGATQPGAQTQQAHQLQPAQDQSKQDRIERLWCPRALQLVGVDFMNNI